MLWRDIIGSIKSSIKKRNSSASKLGKVNAKLNDSLENSSNISKIEGAFWEKLFGALNPNHISVDAKLFDVIKNIWNNLEQIKKKSVLDGRVEDIKFDNNAIEINGITIDCTQELSHLNPTDTQNSINRIEKSDQTLTKLEEIIPELEKRFNDNIKILSNIRNEQSIFTNTPRELNEINENLSEITTLKDHILRITTLLSHINNTLQNKNTKSEWTDSSEGDIWSTINQEKLDNYLKNFNDEISDIENIVQSTKYDDDLQKNIQINDWKINNVNNIDEINEKQGFYSSRLDNINERIKELKHEKTLKENINQLEQLQKNPITIPGSFLPFWDDETIAKEWNDSETTDGYIEDFQNRSTQLSKFKKEIKNIHKRYKKNKDNLEKIKKLQEFHETINNGLREKEIESIIDVCQKLHLWDDAYNPRIQDQVIRIWWNSWEIELNFIDWSMSVDKSIKYSLCDKEWNSLIFDEDKKWWKITLKNKNSFYLKGISFDAANQTMKIEDLEIDPIESVIFPLNLDLNVNVSIEDKKTWLTIDHHKPIHIEINRPILEKIEREKTYSWFETTINEKIKNEYSDEKIKDIENQTIRKILREWWNKSEIDKIYNNTAKKNLFIEKIRNRLATYLPSLTSNKLRNWFKEDMIREDRHIPFKYLLNEKSFKEYIKDNWENCLEDYTATQIYENMSKYRDDILSCFFWPQNLSDGRIRILKKSSENNNYTKFLVWKSCELNGKESKIDDKKTIKYSIKTEVKWVNNITTTIIINGKGPETIEAKNHDELIERILNKSTSKDGWALCEKLRCDIALSTLKSIIAISPQSINRKTQNQKYFDGTEDVTCNRLKTLTGGDWNLKLLAYKINTKNKDQTYVKVFDEGEYKDKYDGTSINELKKNIWKISSEINIVLNSLAQDYQKAIYWENKSLLEYDTNGHLKWEDIKKWRWKLRLGETNNDFNFDTEIDDLAWKKIRISLNQWKFSISRFFDGKEREFKEKDNLWEILKEKVDGKRVFDWVELKIINKINEKYVQHLRSNNLIKNKNYFVSDLGENRTWRIYIFDAMWKLSYLEVWNEWSKLFGNVDAGHIDSSNIPSNIIRCDEEEKREFFENPILAGELIREMKKSLTLLHSKNVSEWKTKRRNKRESFKKMNIKNKYRFIINLFKKSTSNLLNKIYKKKATRYSVDPEISITKVEAQKTLKINYNTDEEQIKYKMRWDLEFTADYLNWKISAKKYLKSLGFSLDGFDYEEIKAEADRKAEMYKPYLKDNEKS